MNCCFSMEPHQEINKPYRYMGLGFDHHYVTECLRLVEASKVRAD